MFGSRLDGVAAQVDALVRDLDIELLSVGECEAAVPVLARVQRQVEAAVVLVAARVVDAKRSEREAAEWFARQTGTSRREASDALQKLLDTAGRIDRFNRKYGRTTKTEG